MRLFRVLPLLIIVTALTVSFVLPTSAQDPTATPTTAPPPDNMISFNPSVLDGTAYQWTVVANAFDIPVGVTYAPDGSGRIFVWQQNGMIWVIMPDGTVPFDPFLDVSRLIPSIVFRGGYTEQGLLGLAFHPDYANNGWFYINYTDTNGDTVIARYTVSADDPNRADRSTALTLLTADQPFENHNGGHMTFGLDGYLYIGLGDGGSQGDPFNNAQNPGSLPLGKILRIDVTEDGYIAPPDNPFSVDPAYLPEVWQIGFRNPWRFSFDRVTGDLYIADVGEWLWEEIDVIPAGTAGGLNFGWNLFESNIPRTSTTSTDGYFVPTIEYSHYEGCSVTGGNVYRGSALPEAQGVYFFGDYCNGFVWTAVQRDGEWQVGLFQQTGRQITSFGEDEAGELYMIDYKGDVLRLERAE